MRFEPQLKQLVYQQCHEYLDSFINAHTEP